MFNVLHSSAGAGKTHALVKHYLLLCLRGPDPSAYAHVLALTFTNKAAGEMRTRILEYLEGLSGSGPLSIPLTDVRDSLMAKGGVTEEDVRARARATLEHILHHWPQLAVSTIDAFTRRLVMPFARDLRLDHDLRMTTEERYYRARAVDLLLEDAGSDPVLTELLIATCEHLLEEERAWRPDQALLALSDQLGKENALSHLKALRDVSNEHFLAVHRRLAQRIAAFRDRMRQLGSDALQAIAQADLVPEDLAHGRSGVHGYLTKLARYDHWLDLNRNALKALEQDKWHSGKADARSRAAIDGIAPVLRNAITAAYGMQDAMKEHAVAHAVWRELLPTASLHALDQRLEQLKQDEAVAFFSDLTRKVAAIVQTEPAPFLFERLGERYDHLLVDEFQDTSVLQWHVLLPLLENALSKGGSALLVGDAKQAIYRWRNGEARQFVMLPELYAKEDVAFGEDRERVLIDAHVHVDPLDGNFRSGRAIIRTNNALFADLAGMLEEDERPVYSGHEQQARRDMEGHVRIHCLEKPEGTDEDDHPATAYVCACVAEALADGARPGDIAVLIRTRAQGRLVAQALIAQGWKVASPDGLALNGDTGVNATVALLAWLHQADDAHAATAVQYMYLLANGTGTVLPFAEALGPRTALRNWVMQHQDLSTRLPLFTLVARLLHTLGIDPAHDAFAMGLLQEVYAFTQSNGDDVEGFLEHWERTGGERSASGTDSPDTIRIMTVHASKGLQFPVVILPFTNMTARGNATERTWIAPGLTDIDLPSALVQLREPLPSLGIPEIDAELRQRRLDALNLLYVAFTRPEQRLYAAVEPTGNEVFGKALRDHFQLTPGSEWTSGEREAIRTKAATVDLDAYEPRPNTGVGQRTLAIRSEAPREWDPADPDPFRSHGRTVHAILARIRTAADLETASADEARAQGLDLHDRDRITARLRDILARPTLAPFFGAGLDVTTEATLITKEGLAKRPDRIVRDALGTRVLDIKTGAAHDTHHDQVLDYARSLEELGEVNVSAHLLYLADGAVIDVIP
jgi:ATP-dependent exoDNAse (exonuclease V) beta subunit